MKIIRQKLKRKDLFLYLLWRNILYFLFVIFFLLFCYKIIFPSKNFIYSFLHQKSLKNTIHDVSFENNKLIFYVSTPQRFSKAKLEVEFFKKNFSQENIQTTLKKSYRAFFYPKGDFLTDLRDAPENKLVASGVSVFVVGNQKKYPVNNPITFESLGYNWDNVMDGKNIDLSGVEKQKLMTIDSTHPSGTFFKTDNGDYYYIENEKKRLLKNIEKKELKNIKNPILVNNKSLEISESCKLKKKLLSSEKFYCLIPIEKLDSFIGKDYRFEINNITNSSIKQISVRFEKSISKDNLMLFLSNLKKRLLIRFGYDY